MAIRLSIIVACRNEADAIREFLDSLLRQNLAGIGWEAIIADGMSDDGTRRILDEYAARDNRIRVIENPGRIVSTGLNSAIRMARGEIVVRMDGHTSYAPNYCRVCLETLLRTGAENVGGPARTHEAAGLARAVAIAYHSPFSTGGARFHNPDYEGPVDTVPYGCWRKSTLVDLGYFDETLVRNQDDELNLRLIRRSGVIWQNPAIVSWYWPRARLGALFRQYFQYGYWKVAVIRKHRIPGSWRHLAPATFTITNILLPLAALAAEAMGERGMAKITLAWWLSLVALYSLATFAASFRCSRNNWRLFHYFPVIFATFHFSYGAGFLSGLARLMQRRPHSLSSTSVFAKITR